VLSLAALSLFCIQESIAQGFLWRLPGVIFINLLCLHFLDEILAPKITKLCFGLEIFGAKILYKKRVHKMLMKLIAEGLGFLP
jgi:hypothetical protein